ncbi:class I SAM-dependent methyltransferase [Endozoicomonas montiporae]|nr:class I SAM-dependent methyltransferase [Endozoicomonas montiporae]
MASLLNLRPETRVLDAGSGLGGPSRFIASEYGCYVTGIDLTGEFCEVARSFARRFGLQDKLSYLQGTVLDLPFEANSYDVVWTQHASMNIREKVLFFSELARVLKPGGFLACFDIIAGSGEPVVYPVSWAESEKISFLASQEDQLQAISQSGFEILSCDDRSQKALAWLEAVLEKQLNEEETASLTYKLLLGERMNTMMSNQIKNFQTGRTKVVQIIARKPDEEMSFIE